MASNTIHSFNQSINQSIKHLCSKRSVGCKPVFSPILTMFLNVFCHRILNPFRNKPRFLRICSTSLLKTLWEKKLLITSNFSFSHSVFYLFLKSFLPSSTKLKLSSANLFNLDESQICHLGKGSVIGSLKLWILV